MRLKQWAALLTALAIFVGGAALGEAYTKADMIMIGLDYLCMLDAEDVETAALYFDGAGNYGQAKLLKLYAQALLDILRAEEDRSGLTIAGKQLALLDDAALADTLAEYGLPSVTDLQMYAAAREYEMDGKYTEALAVYGQIEGTLDAMERVVQITFDTRDALYRQAVTLFNEGKYIEAGEILREMKWKDSAELYAKCLELHEHTWIEATCETPKTCSWCCATEGEALGHDWKPATYAAPETCARCGILRGEPLKKPVPDGLRYNASTARGIVAIAGYDGTETVLDIPDTIEGLPVTSIIDNAFSGNTRLTAVKLPETVGYIGHFAFAGCTGLTEINFPFEMTSIGESAFEGCAALTEVKLPARLGYLGMHAFRNCTGLTGANLPDRLVNYDYDFFGGCDRLTVTVSPGGQAETYCRDNGIPYQTK